MTIVHTCRQKLNYLSRNSGAFAMAIVFMALLVIACAVLLTGKNKAKVGIIPKGARD